MHNPVYDLPADIGDKLLCSHCNGYVSCGPVKSHLDGSSICGRCSPSNDDEYTRNILFETAMSKFTFPCRNKPQGCKERVIFDKAIEHEGVCQYHTFPCPSLPHSNCSENVSVSDLHKHFNEDHLDLITKNGKFKLNFQQNIQKSLLMVKEEVFVIIQYNYDAVKNVLCIDVRHFLRDSHNIVYYKIQIISGLDANCALHWKESQCYRYESYTMNNQNATTLTMSNYLPVLNDPTFVFINVVLSIQNKNCSNTDAGVVASVSLPTSILLKKIDKQDEIIQNTYNLLEKVRCFQCNYPALSPVYEGYCLRDNVNVTACGDCKQFIKSPTEKMYEGLTYPCDWRGCKFMGNRKNIVEHLKDCTFRSYYCPVEPCQKGFFTWNNVMDHMSSHGLYCADPAHVVIKLYPDETVYPVTKVYFTIVEKEVSLFTCTIEKFGGWSLDGLCNGSDVAIYYKHDHCRINTITRSYSNDFSLKSDSQEIEKIFPSCFTACKCIEAIIQLQKR